MASKLVKAIKTSPREYRFNRRNNTSKSSEAARLVLFKDYTYEEAGKEIGVSKQAIYQSLKRYYFKKYGEEYSGAIIDEKDVSPS